MRRQSRELGLQLLYQTEYNAQNTKDISVKNTLDATQEKVDENSLQYAEFLFNGVLKHKDEIEFLIPDTFFIIG